MRLSSCIYRFFDQYLPQIKGVSDNTIKTYRDTFTIFLPYAAQYCSINTGFLKINHITFDLIISFLKHLETDRNNMTRTRNQRLASLKSFAKMIRLIYPEYRETAEIILNIPQKRSQKNLIGYLTQEEIMRILASVDINKKEGFRDYTILHLLFDSGARASEIATLNLDYFDSENKTLAIFGKGKRYRQILLWPRTIQLLKLYILKYRPSSKPLYRHCLFISQRGEELTRHGIHRICKKYLSTGLSPKRLKGISPVHSFRHSCAINMLASGFSITDIKNHLGHEHLQATMIYLNLNLTQKRDIQNKFIKYTQSILKTDPKIEELFKNENTDDILAWLDNL